MENYEEKFELNDLVTGKRTYNGEIIEGEFQGFHLVDKFNSDSIVGVISVKKDRCYDVFPHSIKFVESEDERTRKDIINYIEQKQFGSEPYYEDDAVVQKYLTWLEKQKTAEWSEEDKTMLSYMQGHLQYLQKSKDYSSSEDQKLLKKQLDWLKSLKDRVPPQPKREWSKEDERILNSLLEDYRCAIESSNGGVWEKTFEEKLNWLKSLKPQFHWKPSEEQMKALEYGIDDVKFCKLGKERVPILESLYNDLQKLM